MVVNDREIPVTTQPDLSKTEASLLLHIELQEPPRNLHFKGKALSDGAGFPASALLQQHAGLAIHQEAGCH